MPAASLTRDFAAAAGCRTDNPNILAMYEAIRQSGIRKARAGHYERKAMVDECKAHPSLLYGLIRPALSTDEAIEDATRYIFRFRNMTRHSQQNRVGELCRAKHTRLYARYFRRFGQRIWLAAEAA